MRRQIHYTLQNNAGLTALVGDKVYPQRVPKADALPYVSFIVSSLTQDYEQSGNTGYNRGTFEIEIAGVSIAQCDGIRDAVFSALNLKNTQIGDTGDKIDLDAIYLDSESDDFFLFDGSEDGVRTINQTYTINYR